MQSIETRNEAVASPTDSTFSTNSSGRPSFQSHGRTMSTATAEAPAALRTNRFSIQFPVQVSHASSPVRTSMSPSRESLTGLLDTGTVPSGPTDGNFLTAIAAQERRVLELKEELERAETELAKLKVHWAQHEAKRKRDDAKKISRLQPLQTALPTVGAEDDSDGSSTWMQQEMERRKALLSGSRTSNRTVFSGSRHTRALSLLSPREGVAPPSQRPFAKRKESLKNAISGIERGNLAERSPEELLRATTMPDLNIGTDDQMPLDINSLAQKGIDRELLIQTGKKMATDLKDGLWTFWEDLRQATVGEEATQIPPPRRKPSTTGLRSAKKQSSRSSLRPSSRGSSVTSKASAETKRASPSRKPQAGPPPGLADPSFWSDHGVLSPGMATPAPKKSPARSKHNKTSSRSDAPAHESDAWDTWDDSPAQSRSSSAASEANTQPSTIPSSPTSRDSHDTPRKDPIPWPVLTKLGPAQLRRTASHLMKEWETSLSPSPGEEWTGDDYLIGMGGGGTSSSTAAEKRKSLPPDEK